VFNDAIQASVVTFSSGLGGALSVTPCAFAPSLPPSLPPPLHLFPLPSIPSLPLLPQSQVDLVDVRCVGIACAAISACSWHVKGGPSLPPCGHHQSARDGPWLGGPASAPTQRCRHGTAMRYARVMRTATGRLLSTVAGPQALARYIGLSSVCFWNRIINSTIIIIMIIAVSLCAARRSCGLWGLPADADLGNDCQHAEMIICNEAGKAALGALIADSSQTRVRV